MGGLASRRSAGVEEVDISTNNAYRFPPRSGCYFGSHFIMGGERFETTQPEAYLFGDNSDLNFLGNRPIPFPYPAPQAHEPTKTLKSLVNIRKDSVRFVKANSDKEGGSEDDNHLYNIEFTFDTDVRVAITIFYFATEEISNGHAVYHPRDASMNSETFHFKRGANQTFSQASHIVEPAKFAEEEWQINADKDTIPIVIQCAVEDEPEYMGHSHILFCIVEKALDEGYTLKPLKQKQMVDGLCYLLQEIYGIENKNTERCKDDDFDDNGSECVICMSDTRDTLILPCRHLCLCNCCADNLRYQANNCPICRAPFRALLQIRAMRKKIDSLTPAPPVESDDTSTTALSQEGVPPGYEAVSLIEALNGPSSPAVPSSTPTIPVPIGSLQPLPPDGVADGNNATGKVKRQSSKKRRSQQAIVEEGVEAVEECRAPVSLQKEETRAATPEVVLSVAMPDPVKPVVATQTEREDTSSRPTSCEIVNEINPTAAKAGVEANEAKSPPTPPPDYDSPDLPAAGAASAAAPHTAVLYPSGGGGGKLEEDEEDAEHEPLCLLPSQVEDLSEEPGANTDTGSGSSYSSTNSTKELLVEGAPQQPSSPQ